MAFVQYDFSIGPEHPWVGFDNFVENWKDPVWRASLWRTVWFSVTVVAIELVLGMLLALAMLRPFRGRRVLMTMFVIPLFISPVVVGGFFDLFVRRPYGVANQLTSWVWPGDVTIDFTTDTPWLYIVLFTRRRLAVDAVHVRDPARRARRRSRTRSTRRPTSTGRSRSQAFRFVTLPLLLPIILIAVTFRLIDAAKLFDIIFSLTRGGPGTDTYTTSYYLYQQGFEFFHLGQGTAGAWMFLIMLSFVSFWLVRRLLMSAEEDAR